MALRVYNTLTRKKEVFEPINAGKVGMYVCGVTVYDFCHIGHARSSVLFDTIYRYLTHAGYEVTYVRNFTDVDDKIIKRANEVGEEWSALAQRFIDEFYTDMDALGILRPTFEPRATQYIKEIQLLIEDLIKSGHAYTVDGDVLFSVGSFRSYGQLSGKKIDELVAGARVGVDEKKENPLDFALWKAAKPGEPSWDSPWGPGRPGWHIECSAMSMTRLGQTFDIHGGGADLMFPHHENEIAQSEGATNRPFVKYWIHNGFINISSEKMSKSLGNQLNIRDILKDVHPEALRLFMLSSHYRSPLDYSDSSIKESFVALERLYAAMVALEKLIAFGGKSKEVPEELKDISGRFTEAMDDDFNSPRALAVLFDASRAINRLSGPGVSKKSIPNAEILAAIRGEIDTLSKKVLGILTEDPLAFQDKIRKSGLIQLGMTEEEIQSMIDARAEARKAKDFAKGDEIRDELAQKGILLEDSAGGTTWKLKG
jgi:cysteinyl-tRNA synthetase